MQRQLQRQRWQKQHGSPILALIRAATATAGEARPPNYRPPSRQALSAQTQGRSCGRRRRRAAVAVCAMRRGSRAMLLSSCGGWPCRTYCRAKGGRGSRSGLNSSGSSGRGQECRFRGRWRCCRWRCRWWWRYPWTQLLPLLLRSVAAPPAGAAAVASVSANGVTFATACAPANYSFCASLAN